MGCAWLAALPHSRHGSLSMAAAAASFPWLLAHDARPSVSALHPVFGAYSAVALYQRPGWLGMASHASNLVVQGLKI